MKFIKVIAACAMLASAALTFAHEAAPHHATAKPARSEQTAWGIAGNAKSVDRTITLRMDDNMRFTPSAIEVREGETVRLRVENRGQVMHEIVLGTQDKLQEHAAMMVKFPGMEHDEPYMAHVAAGQQGDIVWQFNRPGNFDFACLIAGHYQAGMTGTITVLPRQR